MEIGQQIHEKVVVESPHWILLNMVVINSPKQKNIAMHIKHSNIQNINRTIHLTYILGILRTVCLDRRGGGGWVEYMVSDEHL